MHGIHSKICRVLAALIMSFLISCEADNPPSIFDPGFKGKLTPEISQIIPADSALAGVGEITIVGKNFSPNKNENFVYVEKNKAEIVSASETEIKIKSPNKPADSLPIKIAVHQSYLFSNIIPYKLIQILWELGGYGEFDDPYALEVDKEENLYVSLGNKTIEKLTPQGVRTVFANLSFLRATGMKFGPDGYLYLSRATSDVYRVASTGGADQRWAKAPGTGRVYDFDFDPNGVIFAGGRNNDLIRIKPDASSINIISYPDVNVQSVRVFNGYVYVGGRINATSQNKVWRNKIISADQLDPTEVYFDFTQNVDPFKSITSMTFSADGDLYIGTDAPGAVIIVHPDGSFEPMFPGVLEPTSYAISWGNSRFLYINRRNEEDKSRRRILKLNALKPGAPYYGRK